MQVVIYVQVLDVYAALGNLLGSASPAAAGTTTTFIVRPLTRAYEKRAPSASVAPSVGGNGGWRRGRPFRPPRRRALRLPPSLRAFPQSVVAKKQSACTGASLPQAQISRISCVIPAYNLRPTVIRREAASKSELVPSDLSTGTRGE